MDVRRVSAVWGLRGVGDSERVPPEVRMGSRKDWIQLEAPCVRSLSSTAVSLPRELRLPLPTAGCTVSQSTPGREKVRRKQGMKYIRQTEKKDT